MVEKSRKAVFLDRDGTLNRDTSYLIRFEDFELLPGVERALLLLQELGYRLFVVTNQSGVARGYFSLEAMESLHRSITEFFAAKGIRLEEIAACPHHTEGIDPGFTLDCDCRKPKPGMIRYLERKYRLDLPGSFIVGDKVTDAETGVNAGATGVWIRPAGNLELLDKPGNIKEFHSLLDFAQSLSEFNGAEGAAFTRFPLGGGQTMQIQEETQIIEGRYKAGQLAGISAHLLEFVTRHRREIQDMAEKSRPIQTLLDATKQLIQHRGSIHLPSEMADQIREINNEIWYRGEHGDYNRSKIQEEWALKYASMWRNFRIKEILYVVDQKAKEILGILSRP